VRAGVGHLHVVDFDTVEASNLNRLAFGFQRYVGRAKTEAFIDAAHEINPGIEIAGEKIFFSGETAPEIIARECSIHADCVDSLSPKASLIAALRREISFSFRAWGPRGASCRTVEARLDGFGQGLSSGGGRAPEALKNADTARFPVVWSDEPAVKPLPGGAAGNSGLTPFVPQTAGHFMAAWIVRRLLEDTHV